MLNDDNIKKLNILSKVNEQVSKKPAEGIINFLNKFVEQASPLIQQIQSTDYMMNFKNGLLEFYKVLSEVHDNPNSILNIMRYEESLENFNWCFPYKITIKEIKEIIETVNSEEEFDKFMGKYLRNNKLKNLFNAITPSENHV